MKDATYQYSEAMVQRVYDYVVREADLDGIATLSSTEVGKDLGIAQTSAAGCLRLLEMREQIVREGRTDGVKAHSLTIWRLTDA